MQLIESREWNYTDAGEKRGYIAPHGLKELWFHTGTACNLSCPFCLEGSSPGDKRLGLVRFREVKPYIDEAVELGVEQLSFTGGEPFLAKDLVDILAYALQFKPCLVLTNGTSPLLKRLEKLKPLVDSEHPLSFRISLDSHIAKIHDQGRGEGMFEEALVGLKALYEMGFHVSVARHMANDEDTPVVDKAYSDMLIAHGLPGDLHLVAFPEFYNPGKDVKTPEITEHCMTTYQTEDNRRQFMCAFSKMLVKTKLGMRVYACTLVDDDPRYDQGSSLRESLENRVILKHHRCFSCFKYGSSCSES